MIIKCKDCGINLAIEDEDNYKCWNCEKIKNEKKRK